METLLNDFNLSMSYDSQHYASNDSGLSSNSNGCVDIDSKNSSLLDFHCDDLTKSLFMNSIEGNELIRDDDIYSYKYKLEIQNMFNNKFRSFNFPKSDNFKNKNSSSFSSIIQDLENLKESEPLSKYPMNIPFDSLNMKDKITNICPSKSMMKPSEENVIDIKYESVEKNRIKKPIKKVRQANNSNNIQEYVSSSIKNYKGNQSLNELVQFIQGTSSNAKSNSSKSKLDKNLPSSTKTEIITNKTIDLSITDDSGSSEQVSPVSKENIKSSATVDVDSGTQSHVVSLNNSDEDTQIIFVSDFQEVVPKNRKKQKKVTNEETPKPTVSCQNQSKLGVKSSKSFKKSNNKCKKMVFNPEGISRKSGLDLLDSKDSLQRFLSDQFSTFMKLSILVS